jgi:hypothetical protein
MVDLQTLFRTVDELNNEELQRLSRYILEKQEHSSDNAQSDTLKSRILGLHEALGHAWMSDDFNAELPDSFWLGEDNS